MQIISVGKMQVVLPGVHDVVRIEHLLDPLHEIELTVCEFLVDEDIDIALAAGAVAD